MQVALKDRALFFLTNKNKCLPLSLNVRNIRYEASPPFTPLPHQALQCLAANAIVKNNVDIPHPMSKVLEQFLALHVSCSESSDKSSSKKCQGTPGYSKKSKTLATGS